MKFTSKKVSGWLLHTGFAIVVINFLYLIVAKIFHLSDEFTPFVGMGGFVLMSISLVIDFRLRLLSWVDEAQVRTERDGLHQVVKAQHELLLSSREECERLKKQIEELIKKIPEA